MVGAVLCGIPLVYVGLRSLREKRNEEEEEEEVRSLKGAPDDGHSVHSNYESLSNANSSVSDSSLLRKHSENISVTTKHYTYPAVRVFYRPHPKASVLPPKLPLLVFLHGLGGQMSQFQYLLEFFVHISHTLAIDLPGCGPSSEFSPKDWDAYTTSRLVEIIAEVVSQRLEDGQQVVLIGHSMGCSLAVTLIAKGGLLADKCAGLVAICPKATVSEKEQKTLKTALALPEFVFNLFRIYDRRGGIVSNSVTRFVGSNSTEKVGKLQLRFNQESRTPVWRRMASGIRLPTEEEWTSVECPTYLLAASEDKVCTTREVDLIHSWFDPAKRSGSVSTTSMGGSADGIPSSSPSPSPARTRPVVKKCIIPDAGHGVMYETPQVVSGLIGEFLSGYVTEVLSLGWQLLYLKEDKWLLKNLEKWTRIQSVSPRIGGYIDDSRGPYVRSPFRAMKTLRQNDPNGHNPVEFSGKWPDVRDAIDISHEQPPYDPEALGDSVRYHKFPTVSKIPPTQDEVASFIELVDSIREERGYDDKITIACHCHYGFNRTGFFVCCYLIQRLGFGVEQAIKAFKDARPPGIRHPHFINELFERHCLGLVRAPTF
ncbi:alpha/beta-hydrolase [Tuber magnatum]|uniref:Alpha/beta-hydrolase n=1 Tax=Tuber magnatum TaxID=42249 RepID=A0A317SZ68_9PEZI|nr:alpha/beta-hydrolase [Tuber magnatum]